MKRLLLLPALLAMFQLQAQQIEEYRYWINDDPTGVTVSGIGPNVQVNLLSDLVLPALTKDYNTITIQFKDTNDVYSVPVSRIFTRNTGAVSGYEYWIDDDIANRVAGTLTAGTAVNLGSNIPLCLTAGTHVFAIRFASMSGTWSVPVTRQFTSTASPDTDGDGLCDALDPCPMLANLAPGSTCDDGNPSTENDMVNANCLCVGTLADEDCEGSPGGPAQPGTACNDNDDCTSNDVYDANCNCAGTFVDGDGDGVCDADDVCPGGPEPGMACNDGNSSTTDDMVDGSCQCAGTPIGCTPSVQLSFALDGVSVIDWEIREQGTQALVQSGGAYLPAAGDFAQDVCLADGCYYLVVNDDGGDGITSGGYLLRVLNGPRIIDNSGNFTSGSTSAILNNGGFCLPLGNDRLITASCDRMELRRSATAACSDRLTADNTPNGTSGNVYQFWFYDPNGTLSLVYPSATGATSNQVSMHNLPSLVEGRLYNVRVRTRISAGLWREWGPACRMRIDNAGGQCASTGLQDEASNSHLSCGATKPLGSGSASLVFAKPVSRFTATCGTQSANKYQFRFRNPAEGLVIVKNGVGSNPWTYLNMAGVVGTPMPSSAVLQPCAEYEVEVRASFDGGLTWCRGGDSYTDLAPWGKVCDLFTAGCAVGEMVVEGSISDPSAGDRIASLALYPNPNQGDQIFLTMRHVPEGVGRVGVEMHNMQGQRVMSTTLAAADGFVSGALNLDGGLGAGMYVVSVTVGDRLFTERLVVQP